MFLLYLAIGLFHLLFRKMFLALSYEGHGSFKWEFFFFLSFAFLLMSSVKFAGILQVFAYLILPALIGRLYTRKTLKVLLGGWLIGLGATIFGITMSYLFDLPTSAVIVTSLSLTFMVLLSIKLVPELLRYR